MSVAAPVAYGFPFDAVGARAVFAALAALFERCVVLDDAREARRGLEAGVLERVRIAKF